MFICTISLLNIVLAVSGYRFEDITRFQNEGCWDAMLIDVRAKITTLGSCFYPKNSSLSESVIPMMFVNGSAELPNVLFNPIHYAKYLGFTEEKYYGEETFQLRHWEGMPSVKSKVLDKHLAMQVMKEGHDHLHQKYSHFCAVKSHFTLVLNCLANEIPSLLPYYRYYCLPEQSDDVQLGIQLSAINWGFYEQLCDKVYKCSDNPIQDCRNELYDGVHIQSGPLTTMESVCRVMPDFDTKFAPCLRERVEECSNKVKHGYDQFIYEIQKFRQQYLPFPGTVKSLCQLIENMCTEPQHWMLMNSAADSCFKDLYEMNRMSGGRGLVILSAGDYNLLEPMKTKEICDSITATLNCVWNATQTLPCSVDYSLLMQGLLEDASSTCYSFYDSDRLPGVNGPPPIFPTRSARTTLPRRVTITPPLARPTTRAPPPTQQPITVRLPTTERQTTRREVEQQNENGVGCATPLLYFIISTLFTAMHI